MHFRRRNHGYLADAAGRRVEALKIYPQSPFSAFEV